MNNDKPIKIVFEDRNIEKAFEEYFEKITKQKPDKVKWSDDGMVFEASCKLNKELLSNVKLGIYTI